MNNHWKGLGSFGTLGLEIVLAIMLGLFGGRWLDQKFHTEPYLAVVGFFFGLTAASKAIWRTWKEMQRETAREEREEGNPAPLWDVPERPRDVSPVPPAGAPDPVATDDTTASTHDPSSRPSSHDR
jgi:ATP synthase protein I